jgi:uncharacterized membrane protein
MRLSRREILTILVIVLLFFGIGACFYPQMPERIASHWNAEGQADGSMSRFWGLFFLPFMMVGLLALLIVIPRIDPLAANIQEFRKYYFWFIILFEVFFLYIYLLSIAWNLGARFDMIQLMAPGFGVLIYYAGVLIGKAKRNWSIGIRTPWTLSNEKVWEKSHLIGGRLFKASGVIALLGLLLPQYAVFFVLIPVILAALASMVYSYFEYRRVTTA